MLLLYFYLIVLAFGIKVHYIIFIRVLYNCYSNSIGVSYMIKKMPVKTSDFKELIINQYCIDDKSLFIKDILDKGSKVNVIIRPESFDKTTNISMIKYFFDMTNKDSNILFNNLSISKFSEYKKYQNKYPVIFVSLKDIKYNSWEETYNNLKKLIQTIFINFSYLTRSQMLQETEKEYFNNILNSTGNIADYSSSLARLTDFLYKHHNIKPILLIDEYDVPIQQVYTYKFYNNLVRFMKNWLRSVLNNNISLEFSILTGSFQVVATSIFDGLNSLEISTLLDNKYSLNFNSIK